MFLWSFVHRWGDLGKEKIILKEGLKKAPGFGWAMQKFCFLFLKRSWQQDEKRMEEVLQHFVRLNYPLQLLLFPEGTDLSLANQKRNEEFTSKNNLPTYRHLLYPRLKGWQHTIKVLGSSVNAVYDITVGYPDIIPQTEAALLNATVPKEVHFHVKRYPIRDLPQGETELGEWCVDRWNEKERMLDAFYKSKSFPDTKPSAKNVFSSMRVSAAAWGIFLAVVLFSLCSFSAVRWYFLIACICETAITYIGGAESFEIKSSSKRKGN